MCVSAFRAQGQYGNPQRSGQGHKGQSEWRKRKRGLGGQPTGSMVNPRPPPLLFIGLGFRSLCS